MRIGLYGMPTAGKTYVLDEIDFIDVVIGSKLLREYDPEFDKRDEKGREKDRKEVARLMLERDNFIMDGHYAFGDEIAFTEEEGQMYDIYIYLYVDPNIITERMKSSLKNNKYLKYDIAYWQKSEIDGLREYCHKNNKDFYVIDNPPSNSSEDLESIIKFIKSIVDGYSCIKYARQCALEILSTCESDSIVLVDGDKTLIREDTSKLFLNYETNLFDGNYYTGYQVWKQHREFREYVNTIDINKQNITYNKKVLDEIKTNSYILTSGNDYVWQKLSKKIDTICFSGEQMSAETKLYITKLLQAAGKKVIAYGDSMNDYYMLKCADKGYLISKADGSISKSLRNKDLEGLTIV